MFARVLDDCGCGLLYWLVAEVGVLLDLVVWCAFAAAGLLLINCWCCSVLIVLFCKLVFCICWFYLQLMFALVLV